MKFDTTKLRWTREPANFTISADKIEIVTKPHTDLWQRTYYHFRNDNAPVFQMTTDEKFFCHKWDGKGTIRFGVYACSPENSSFKATFTNMEMMECQWLAHDGQKPGEC